MRLPALPARGETVTGGRFLQAFGGKGANSVVAAARLGSPTTAAGFVARLGNDAQAESMLAAFGRDGIGVEHVTRDPEMPSGAALVMVGDAGDNYLAVAPGSNHRLMPEHVDAAREMIADSAVLLTQMEVPAETVRHAIELAAAAGVTVILNFAPTVEADLDWDKVDVLVVNETEAEQLGRGATLEASAVALLGRGVGRVVITLGADGVLIVEERGVTRVEAFEVKAVDTTAAGDTFCGALAVRMAEGSVLEEACRWAQAAAALCVTGLGAQPSIPTRSEVERWLQSR
ncbi:MAG: ribokinase [Planctomycetota bacterium]